MLTPEKLNYILDRAKVQRELEDSILRDIVRRIVKTDYVTETAAWQAERAQQAGILYSEIIDEVARTTGASRKEIEALFKAAKVEIFDAGDNPTRAMERIWQAAMTKTFTTARNLTQTTAITTQWAYIEAADLAHMQITSGAFTYQQAITNAVKRAAKQGGVVRYPTGAKTQLAAAIRRAVLTGINQTAGKLCEMRCDELDCDLVEVTAHYGARPSHAEWQGGVYSRSGNSTEYESLVDATGYGTGEGLMGWNCAHGMHPFFKGSVRMYDSETLRDMKEHKVTYNGKEMGDYEASQLQRRMERGIRESKNTLTALNEQGRLSPSDEQKAAFAKEAVTLKKREARLKDFCNQTKRRSDTFRTQSMSFDRSVSQKAVWANKKSVASAANGGIMKTKGGNNTMNAEALSTRFVNSSERLYKNAEKIKPIEGYEDIVIHGDKIGFSYHDKSGKEYCYSVSEFAEILKASDVYHGGNIRLISCETGADGAIAAQYLANAMNVNVMAPSDIVWVMPDGTMSIGITPSANDGEWKIFKPKEGK